MPILRVPPTNLLTNISKISTRFLDTVNDSYIGGTSPFGTGGHPVPGMLGSAIYVNNKDAAKLGKNTTLYGGVYMYVNFKTGSTAANVIGQPVAWDTYANAGHTAYCVTPDIDATNYVSLAGVTLYAVTKGNYGWIFCGPGICAAQLKSGCDTTLGDIVVSVASQKYFDTATIGTTLNTYALAAAIVGYAYQTPVSAAVKNVWFY